MAKTQQKQTSVDGYADMVKMIGAKSPKSEVFAPEKYTFRQLANIYRFDGVGKNICNCVADDGTAPGFEIDGDTGGEALKLVNSVGIRKAIRKAAKWTRAFGGSVVVKKIADGRKLQEEAGKEGEIVGFNVYPCCVVSVDQDDYDKDQTSAFYGEPIWYSITMANGEKIRVHRTRCEIFQGEEVPFVGQEEVVEQSVRLFGDSALVPEMKRLNKLGISEEGISDLMSEVNIAFMKLNGLDAKLSAKNGMQQIRTRFQAIEEGKSMCRAIIGDTTEDVTILNSSLVGIPETTYRQMQLLVAAAGLPMAKIFGESSSGLSTTGEGNRKMYDQKVETWRDDHLTDPVESLVSEVLARNAIETKLSSITWNSVSQPSDEEFVKMFKDQTDSFHTLIQDGVISPIQARTMMFKNGHTFRPSLPEEDEGEE